MAPSGLIDLSNLDMLTARDVLWEAIQRAARAANMDPNVECTLLPPARGPTSSFGDIWRIMWEAGPYQWGTRLSSGSPLHFESDVEWQGLGLPSVVMGRPDSWHLEPYYSFDVGFVPDMVYGMVGTGAPLSPGSRVVAASGFVASELMRELGRHPDLLRTIERRQFERVVAELFNGFGYDVELTARTRDGGRDIIAIKRVDEVNLRFLIECKRPDTGNNIGVSTVRELLGVYCDDKATKALLVTTTSFTRGAIELLSRHRWQLEGKAFGDVVAWVQQYGQLLSPR